MVSSLPPPVIAALANEWNKLARNTRSRHRDPLPRTGNRAGRPFV
jgi:hypothetical protein